MAAKNWIQAAHLEHGALHKALNIPMGEKIPEKKLQAAMNSKDPHIRKMADAAERLKQMRAKKG